MRPRFEQDAEAESSADHQAANHLHHEHGTIQLCPHHWSQMAPAFLNSKTICNKVLDLNARHA